MKNGKKTDAELKAFLKKRDAALKAGGEKWFEFCREENAPGEVPRREVLEISLHKCRVHWRNCPPKKLKESVWWLLDHGCSLNL